jgi:3-dehydroquinate dehydratase II
LTRILVLHGPNLNLTGLREPETYGTTTLPEIDQKLQELGRERGIDLHCVQSNHEGELIDALHTARGNTKGAIFNPGAFAHYSYALRDAVSAVDFPVIEVHMSLTVAREPFRHTSVIAPVCKAQIAGFGALGYQLALDGLLRLLDSDK